MPSATRAARPPRLSGRRAGPVPGRYPAFGQYALSATRKDDRAWEFVSGLDFVLDGIAQRLGI
ncbi:hypothetical protein [Streptomyces swartbergensis]|uniref:hypothetical protein n=1 Tax=Streptomyces swartbergensis TaxID=487165 RepID=UPI0037FDD193